MCFLTCSSPGYSSLLIALVQLVHIKEIFKIHSLCCSFMIYRKHFLKLEFPTIQWSSDQRSRSLQHPHDFIAVPQGLASRCRSGMLLVRKTGNNWLFSEFESRRQISCRGPSDGGFPRFDQFTDPAPVLTFKTNTWGNDGFLMETCAVVNIVQIKIKKKKRNNFKLRLAYFWERAQNGANDQ